MEEFFKNYQYTFAAIGSIVAGGVYLAKKYYKSDVDVLVTIKNHSFYEESCNDDFIVFQITNHDSLPISIREESLSLKGHDFYPIDCIDPDPSTYDPAEELTHNYYSDDGKTLAYNPLSGKKKKYPVLIMPGHSMDFYITTAFQYLESSKKKIVPQASVKVGGKFVFKCKFSKILKERISSINNEIKVSNSDIPTLKVKC